MKKRFIVRYKWPGEAAVCYYRSEVAWDFFGAETFVLEKATLLDKRRADAVLTRHKKSGLFSDVEAVEVTG